MSDEAGPSNPRKSSKRAAKPSDEAKKTKTKTTSASSSVVLPSKDRTGKGLLRLWVRNMKEGALEEALWKPVKRDNRKHPVTGRRSKPDVNKENRTIEEHRDHLRKRIDEVRAERRAAGRRGTVHMRHVPLRQMTISLRTTWQPTRGDSYVKVLDIPVDTPHENMTERELRGIAEVAIDKWFDEQVPSKTVVYRPKSDDILSMRVHDDAPPVDPANLPMREVGDAARLLFDGDGTLDLMTKDLLYRRVSVKGQCVPSLLLMIALRYNGVPGKPTMDSVKMDMVEAYFPCRDPDGNPDDEPDPYLGEKMRMIATKDREGYSGTDIWHFYVKHGGNMLLFVIDDFKNPIVKWRSPSRNTHLKTLVGIVHSGHLYLVSGSQRKSMIKMHMPENPCAAGKKSAKKTKKDEDGATATSAEPTFVIVGDRGGDEFVDPDNTRSSPWKALEDSAQERGRMPQANNITYSPSLQGPVRWKFTTEEGPIVYKFGDGSHASKDVALGLDVKWSAQEIGAIVQKYHDDVFFKKKPVYGRLSPGVFDALTQPNAKDPVLRGYLRDEVTEEEKKAIVNGGLSVDVASAYPYLIVSPMDSWMVPELVDELAVWTDSNQAEFERTHTLPANTLFFVAVEPYTRDVVECFQSTKPLCDRVMLYTAMELGYTDWRITGYVTFSDTQPEDHYASVFDDVCERFLKTFDTQKKAYEVLKHVGRVFSGAVLGSTHRSIHRMTYSSERQEVLNWVQRQAFYGNDISFRYPQEWVLGHDQMKYYVTIASKTYPRYSTHVAQYIQLTNWWKVHLLKLDVELRKTFGRAVHAHVDCLMFPRAPIDDDLRVDSFVTPIRPDLQNRSVLVRDVWGRARV